MMGTCRFGGLRIDRELWGESSLTTLATRDAASATICNTMVSGTIKENGNEGAPRMKTQEPIRTTASAETEGLEAEFEAFCKAYPEFNTTRDLDDLREKDYAR